MLKLEEDFEEQSANLQAHAENLRRMESKIMQIGLDIVAQDDQTKAKK